MSTSSNPSAEAFASLLSEARKFATHFCLANQYTEQLSDGIRAAVLGNAGTLMVFRVSAADAELLAPEFHLLPAHELADQSPYRAWLRRGDSGHRAVFVSPRQDGVKGRWDIVVRQSQRNSMPRAPGSDTYLSDPLGCFAESAERASRRPVC